MRRGRGPLLPPGPGPLTMVRRRRRQAGSRPGPTRPGPAGCRPAPSLPPALPPSPPRAAPGEAPAASRLPTMPRKGTARAPPPRRRRAGAPAGGGRGGRGGEPARDASEEDERAAVGGSGLPALFPPGRRAEGVAGALRRPSGLRLPGGERPPRGDGGVRPRFPRCAPGRREAGRGRKGGFGQRDRTAAAWPRRGTASPRTARLWEARVPTAGRGCRDPDPGCHSVPALTAQRMPFVPSAGSSYCQAFIP